MPSPVPQFAHGTGGHALSSWSVSKILTALSRQDSLARGRAPGWATRLLAFPGQAFREHLHLAPATPRLHENGKGCPRALAFQNR